jgi:hypothetical protein
MKKINYIRFNMQTETRLWIVDVKRTDDWFEPIGFTDDKGEEWSLMTIGIGSWKAAVAAAKAVLVGGVFPDGVSNANVLS